MGQPGCSLILTLEAVPLVLWPASAAHLAVTDALVLREVSVVDEEAVLLVLLTSSLGLVLVLEGGIDGMDVMRGMTLV